MDCCFMKKHADERQSDTISISNLERLIWIQRSFLNASFHAKFLYRFLGR